MVDLSKDRELPGEIPLMCGNRVGGSILNITIDIGWSVNVNVDITPNVAMQVGTWPELRKINCYQVL